MSKIFYLACCENKDSSFNKKKIDEIWFDYNFSGLFLGQEGELKKIITNPIQSNALTWTALWKKKNLRRRKSRKLPKWTILFFFINSNQTSQFGQNTMFVGGSSWMDPAAKRGKDHQRCPLQESLRAWLLSKIRFSKIIKTNFSPFSHQFS